VSGIRQRNASFRPLAWVYNANHHGNSLSLSLVVVVVVVAVVDRDVRGPSLVRADVKIDDILSVNHGLKKDVIEEGQTILLPSSKLSERDREILDGVKGRGKYRAYPVRKGESIEDIIEKRGIKMTEVEALNEGVDLTSLKAFQVIKLPRNKYTEREKEMLVGCARVPAAFFSGRSGMAFGKMALVVLVAGVAAIAAWKSRDD